ncbi:LacI family DNA-binding transcriptional regulator [Hespellia stercorisuis]|uniref:Transcriptional regulator, LacI family n=1 Tax=Hespellia stercorisuis DSM 15480 TaxID=1121950 RepID=A0A1M6MHJ1_9FIRM|nr:LacI family DNA-binding transcriptional regulator [Hespellia stercorisuis]SHJ82846.1 transcriptional regulator, LacI family [Hespellia stercorisuis DSM 15480]
MKISIKSISKATGFSPATVSNALNNKKGVNQKTASEIRRVAKEMGYISENRITKVKFVIYKRTGAIIDDSPFFNLLIDGAEKECRKFGYEMIICHLDRFAADYEEQVHWLIRDTDAAVILLGTELMEDDIELYKDAKCPFLLFDYFDPSMSFDGVLIDNDDSARVLTEYLIAKGHEKIGYLKGNFRIQAFKGRANGYRRALKNARLPAEEKYCFTLDTTMDGAYRQMLKILKDRPELPTAFFADNDMIALGAMKAFQESGYRIPDDISIAGFDDLPFSEIVSPRLTTIRVSKPEMGGIAVRKLHEIINQMNRSKSKISVCTDFIERDSVKDIHKMV